MDNIMDVMVDHEKRIKALEGKEPSTLRACFGSTGELRAPTIKKLIDDLKKLSSGDEEVDHIRADDLLLAYIDDDKVREAFDSIDKYYA